MATYSMYLAFLSSDSAALNLLSEPWFYCIKGNHEYTAEKIWNGLATKQMTTELQFLMALWTLDKNGGGWFDELSHAERQFCLTQGVSLISELPLALTIHMRNGCKFGVVHASPLSGDWAPSRYESVSYDEIKLILESREQFGKKRHTVYGGIDAIFVGHNVTDSPQGLLLGNVFYLDTGAWEESNSKEFLIVDVDEFCHQITSEE